MERRKSGVNSAVICEFNPLHSGHQYLMDFAKSEGENLLLLQSGNFCQRGDISVLDKFEKAKLSLEYGTDIVLELPSVFAVSPAKDFAFYAVKIIHNTNFVKKLCFGSECGDINLLKEVAKMQLAEEKSYSKILHEELKSGKSFATASNISLQLQLEKKGLGTNFAKSNNILALEYIKSLLLLESKIEPVTIKREDNFTYTGLDGKFASATAIRQNLSDERINNFLPKKVFEAIWQNKQNGNLPDLEKYFLLLRQRLLTAKTLKNIYGISEGIENLLAKNIKCENLQEFLKNCTTKRYNENKIMRIIFAVLTETTAEFAKRLLNNSKTYSRVLAVKDKKILSKISNLVVSVSDIEKFSDPDLKTLLQKDIAATRLYSLICQKPQIFNGDYFALC